MWVLGEVTLLLALEDQNGEPLALNPAAATDPAGWTKLTFEYANAPLNLKAVKTVKIFIAAENPADQGRFVLDEIILVP